jgi:geranylgeranyl diphosphate synthase type II
MIDLEKYLEGKTDAVNRALMLSMPTGGPALITAAMRYSIDSGGKRLRPVLTLATAEALGAEDSAVMDVACALELIHTYSLIHDDLPAMDNSDLRRGVPTCHRVYGDAIAVLTGDALLTLAFERIARFGSINGNAEKAIKILALMAESAGAKGMIGGQTLDLLAEGKDLTLEEVKTVAALKTGALLQAAVVCGAIAAGASEIEQTLLRRYALAIGTAFQIVDDLLDYESTTEELGKPTGADQAREKATYPALLGPLEARRHVEALHGEALAALEKLDCPTELLAALAGKLVYRKK